MKTYKEFKEDINIDERYDKDLDADGNGKLTKRDFALLRKKKKKTDCMEAAEKPSSPYFTDAKGVLRKEKPDAFNKSDNDKYKQGEPSDAKKKKYAELGLKCEESEELELAELSKATLDSYITKAKSSDNVAGDNQRHAKASIDRAIQNPSYNSNITPAMHVKRYTDSVKTQANRTKGISTAAGKLTKEDLELEFKLSEAIEELEEVLDTSKATNSYLIKSLEKRKGLIAKNKPFNAEIQRKINKSFAGSHKAIDKTNIAPLGKVKEDFEELEELDKKTLGSYIKKAHDQLIKHTAAVNVKTGRGDPDAFAYSHEPDTMRKSANRDKGIASAVRKLTKEDLELALEMALSEEIEYKNPDDKLKHIHITRDKVTGKVTNINHTVSGKDGRNYDTDVDVNDNTLNKHLEGIKSAVGKTRISINGSRGEPIRIDSDNVDQHIKDIKDAHSDKKGLEQFSPAKTLPKGSVQRPIGDRDRHSGM